MLSTTRRAAIGAAPLAVVLAPYAANAATINVCAACTYTTIGNGVQAANTGDTVAVAPGTYTESVTINKDILVIGTGGSAATIWNGNTGNQTISLNGSGAVTVQGFTIRPKVGMRRAIDLGGSADLSLTDVVIENFSANQDGVGLRSNGSGTSLIATNCVFRGLTATGKRGAAIYSAAGSTLVIAGSTFDTNTANNGGAVYTEQGVPLTVTGSTFTSNSADNDGGALYTARTTLSVSGSTFRSNFTIGAGANGGGIYYDNTIATIAGSTFESNRANDGGAMYASNASTVTVTSSTFTSNRSTDAANAGGGGAVFVSSAAAMTILGSTFTSNVAGSWGGGIFGSGAGTLTVRDATFTSNTAARGGGGMAISTATTIESKRNWFCSNSSSADGGGAWIGTVTAATNTWKNNLFIENTATARGGGIYTTSAGFYNNNDFLASRGAVASGGEVYTTQALTFVNNLVAYTPAGNGVQTTSNAGTYTYGDWYQNTASNIAGSITTLPASNLFVDPLLYGYSGSGGCKSVPTAFHLAYGSPLINAGDPDPAYNDPDTSRADIGAFGGPDAPDFAIDVDKDGWPNVYDCNDNNAAVYPGATEACNLVDDDCDKLIDEGVAITFYRDADTDTYGSATGPTAIGCTAPAGYVANNADCDDTKASISPAATEVCDLVDNDCDAQIDEGTKTTFYADVDKDTYGNPAATSQACTAPAGFVANNTDCDDTTATIRPGAAEVCDGKDQDCDSVIDEGVKSTFYADADVDTYGNPASTTQACTAPAGFVANSADCNDTNAAISPADPEVCNGIDDDCDAQIDDGVKTTFYADTDSDTFGNPASTTQACAAPAGFVANSADCNDTSAAISPADPEVCNGVDDDCDAVIDDGVKSNFYADTDGDTYGDPTKLSQACSAPAGFVANNTDCLDSNSGVHPGAVEACNGLDDNCDGTVDEGVTFTWYKDADSDTFGDPTSTTTAACTAPAGYVGNATDCDDTKSAINPSATEVCDTADNDCDKQVDEGVTTRFYTDADADTYGNAASSVLACSAPAGTVSAPGDCDDADKAINPGASELCDGKDQDCDGNIDEGVTTTYFRDADADAYGTAVTTQACSQPAGFAAASGDCNDASASINPAATEVCDGVDQDCDGLVDDGVKTTFFADTDADTFGDATKTTQACAAPAGYVANNSDCDDVVNSIHPGAAEVCDTIDQDCDGLVDEGAIGPTWFKDGDNDGQGTVSSTTKACAVPSGYAGNALDCDDANAFVFDGAPEQCNGVDDDCDTAIDDNVVFSDFYADTDGDTYGDAGSTQNACKAPAGYVLDDTDCDDAAAGINPGATEVCNGKDDDCDGTIDGAGAVGATTFYADTDADSFGDAAATAKACSAPAGFVSNAADCDDTDATIKDGTAFYPDADADTFGSTASSTKACAAPAGFVATSGDCDDATSAVNPSAAEVCNGTDDDCNGTTDVGATDAGTWYTDADNDTYGAGAGSKACAQPAGTSVNALDCDDASALTSPGAPEQCNGVDDDCDGTIDDNVVFSDWYPDADADSYGDANATPLTDCKAPVGTTFDNTDCDDAAAAVNPNALELCNNIDDDCDGVADDNPTNPTTWYLDADNDGAGDALVTTTGCTAPTGYVANGGDCNDGDPTVGSAGYTWYVDGDADGFGDALNTLQACTQPAGAVSDDTDCDDTDDLVNPARIEVCNGVDDDCDGDVDSTAIDSATWYADTDNDTYGDPADAQDACSRPAGYTDNDDDCDDTSFLTSPGAPEQCNNADDDCDGLVDDNVVDTDWYPDADTDGYGDGSVSPTTDCLAPAGYTFDDTDCDDLDAAVNPVALEVCNLVDDDCDGVIDGPTSTDATTFWVDADTDGYGNPLLPVDECTAPNGTVDNDLDCDDSDPTVTDGITFFVDADGDGLGDATATVVGCTQPAGSSTNNDDCDDANATVGGETSWYVDADLDSYGDPNGASVLSCTQPPGRADNDDDCDDADFLTSPGAPEQCNGKDDNCDGIIDNDVVNTDWYPDVDGDGFGDGSGTPVTDCVAPAGTTFDTTDCDDTDAAINPAGTEVCNGEDDDCDGLTDNGVTDGETYYVDVDGDGLGDPLASVQACSQPPGTVTNGDDCNDGDPAVTTGATYYADADGDGLGDADTTVDACLVPPGFVDNSDDCADDDELVGLPTDWYADADNDTFGDPASTPESACFRPSGTSDNDDDCDDADPNTNPIAPEQCNTEDDDCDGLVDEDITETDWYSDDDGDGWGDTLAATDCLAPAGAVFQDGDCDDDDETVNPNAVEECDGVDQDCNGTIDDVADPPTWYGDSDEDGFGDVNDRYDVCDAPAGTVDDNTDCDDTDAFANPDATEQCNGKDDDCDGTIDNDVVDQTWFVDTDGDGFGDVAVTDCVRPTDGVLEGGDCDDADDTVYPGADDPPGDGIDQACDGNGPDTGDTGDDTGPETGDTSELVGIYQGGCKCNTGSANPLASLAALGLVLLAFVRRRA